MNILVEAAAVALLLPTTLAAGYYWLLALASLSSRSRPVPVPSENSCSFAIIIPAHNEEGGISATLASCERLDYPRSKFQIFVVADNCTDQTALVARRLGITCLERHDWDNRGKGHALAFAFAQIKLARFDAILVLDADCQVESNALCVFSRYISQGERVLQANYVVANPEASPLSYALAVGNLSENQLFYAPKSRCGLAVLLRGTGFVLQRQVLEEYPWNAHSIVEDIEYSLSLLADGVSIRYVDETAVHSAFPTDYAQLAVQRNRWAGGNVGVAKRRIPQLVIGSISRRDCRMFDAALTLLVLSRPTILLMGVLATVGAAALCVRAPSSTSFALLTVGCIVLLSLVLYLALAIARLGMTRRRAAMLLKVPFVVAQLTAIAVKALLVPQDKWARTPRSSNR